MSSEAASMSISMQLSRPSPVSRTPGGQMNAVYHAIQPPCVKRGRVGDSPAICGGRQTAGATRPHRDSGPLPAVAVGLGLLDQVRALMGVLRHAIGKRPRNRADGESHTGHEHGPELLVASHYDRSARMLSMVRIREF